MKIKYGCIVLLLLLAVVFFTGCDRYIESKNPVRDLPVFDIVPANLNAFIGNGTVTLTWTVDAGAVVSRYVVYAYDSGFIDDDTIEYEPLNSFNTTATIYTFENLAINQTYYFRVAAVNAGGFIGGLSKAVSARISYISMRINNHAEYTNNKTIQVQFTSPVGTTHYILSEDENFNDAEYVAFAQAANFILSDGDGLKTLYAQLQYSDGNLSEILSASITLDTKVEIDSLKFVSADTILTADTVFFYLYSSETGGKAQVRFSGKTVELADDGISHDQSEDDGIYSGLFVVPIDFSLIHGDYTGQLTDKAGNTASLTVERELNIFSIPGGVHLFALGISNSEIQLSWSQSGSSDFFAYQIFRSVTSPVLDSTQPIATITSVGTTGYTDTGLDSATTFYYRVFEITTAGFKTGSNEVSAATFVDASPSSPIFIAPKAAGSNVEQNKPDIDN